MRTSAESLLVDQNRVGNECMCKCVQVFFACLLGDIYLWFAGQRLVF